MGGSRRQAGDDLRAGLTPVCRARTGRYLQADARAAHLISIFVPRREHSRNWQCKAVFVGLLLVCGVWNVRWCAYNSITRIIVSKLLLDTTAPRSSSDLVVVLYPIRVAEEGRSEPKVSYSKVSRSARSQLHPR